MQKAKDFQLTREDKITLLKIARKTIEELVFNNKIAQFDPAEFGPNLNVEAGAFVTLKIDGKLRGCIGRFMPRQPLWEVVRDMAIAAASEDPRFTPVTAEEVERILIEISVLTPLKPVKSPADVVIGKHGVYCSAGYASGTLLPQVAVEEGWSAEEFVGYCCKHKAGLDWECWKYADLYVYEAIVFDESEF